MGYNLLSINIDKEQNVLLLYRKVYHKICTISQILKLPASQVNYTELRKTSALVNLWSILEITSAYDNFDNMIWRQLTHLKYWKPLHELES